MVAALKKQGRLAQDAPVFLNYMARTLHGNQAEIGEKLEEPFAACYDGLTAEIIENQ